MNRLFVRTYIGLCITYVIALMAGAQWLHPQPQSDVKHIYERVYGGGLSLAVDRIAASPPSERAKLLSELEARFGFGVAVLPWSSDGIDADARAELAAGARSSWWQGYGVRGGGSFLAAPLVFGVEIVRLGPLPASRPPSYARMGSVIAAVGAILALGAFFLLRSIARPFNAMAEDLRRRITAQRELLRAVSHELRTPLARLRFAIDRLADTDSPDAREAQLDEIDGDLGELDDLVDELLTFSRLEHGDDPLHVERVALHPLLVELVELFEQGQHGQHAAIDIDAGARELAVQGDRRLLRRALDNVLRNAQRHAKARVLVRVTQHAPSRLRILVEDDGDGVPAGERERVFEPFVRLPSVRLQADPSCSPEPSHSRRSGVGLGLSIVRSIASRHGGTVWIEDASLGGCRVVLELPRGT